MTTSRQGALWTPLTLLLFVFFLASPVVSSRLAAPSLSNLDLNLCSTQETLYGVCVSKVANEQGTWICEIDPLSGKMTVVPFAHLPLVVPSQWVTQVIHSGGPFGSSSVVTQIENWFVRLAFH